MLRVLRSVGCAALAAVLALPVAAQPPPAGSPAPQPMPKDAPTLLGLITQSFAKSPGLAPTDGVNLTEATYSKGTIALVGTVASDAQKTTVQQKVESLKGDIQNTLDLRVATVDVSGLTVKAGVSPGPGPGPSPSPAPGPSPGPIGTVPAVPPTGVAPSAPAPIAPPAVGGCADCGSPAWYCPSCGGATYPSCEGPSCCVTYVEPKQSFFSRWFRKH